MSSANHERNFYSVPRPQEKQLSCVHDYHEFLFNRHHCPSDQNCLVCEQRSNTMCTLWGLPMGRSNLRELSQSLIRLEQRIARPIVLVLVPDIELPSKFQEAFSDRGEPIRHDWDPLFKFLKGRLKYDVTVERYDIDQGAEGTFAAALQDQIRDAHLVICIICPPPIVPCYATTQGATPAYLRIVAYHWDAKSRLQIKAAVKIRQIRETRDLMNDCKLPLIVVGVADVIGRAIWPEPAQVYAMRFEWFLTFSSFTAWTFRMIGMLMNEPDWIAEAADWFSGKVRDTDSYEI